MSESRVVVDVTIGASIDEVWHALRDPETLKRWHGWDYDQLDEEVREIYLSPATVADEHNHRLDIGGDVFHLTETAGGTRVVVTRAARDESGGWDGYYDEIDEGWTTFAQQLKFYLERHAGKPRRTVRVSSSRTDGADPLEHSGLTTLREAPVGSEYAGQLADEPISGTVWYRSDRQVGVTVEQWGDALLVVSEGPTPEEDGSVLVSTYSLSDAEVARIERSLNAAWSH